MVGRKKLNSCHRDVLTKAGSRAHGPHAVVSFAAGTSHFVQLSESLISDRTDDVETPDSLETYGYLNPHASRLA